MRILTIAVLAVMLAPSIAYADAKSTHIVTIQCDMVFDDDGTRYFDDCEITEFSRRRPRRGVRDIAQPQSSERAIVVIQCELIFGRSTSPYFDNCEIVGFHPRKDKK